MKYCRKIIYQHNQDTNEDDWNYRSVESIIVCQVKYSTKNLSIKLKVTNRPIRGVSGK